MLLADVVGVVDGMTTAVEDGEERFCDDDAETEEEEVESVDGVVVERSRDFMLPWAMDGDGVFGVTGAGLGGFRIRVAVEECEEVECECDCGVPVPVEGGATCLVLWTWMELSATGTGDVLRCFLESG